MTKEEINKTCEVCGYTIYYHHKAKDAISKGLCKNCGRAEQRGREKVVREIVEISLDSSPNHVICLRDILKYLHKEQDKIIRRLQKETTIK